MKRVLVVVGVLAAFVTGMAVERVRSEAKPRVWPFTWTRLPDRIATPWTSV
jgi:hypothetical protein